MSDEKRRVLDLLAQGKITVDEADQLLAALDASAASSGASSSGDASATDADAKPRYLRIAVKKTRSADADQDRHGHGWAWTGFAGGDRDKEVNIRVPIALVKSGMRLGAMIPGLAGDRVRAHLRERGVDIDLSKIDASTIDKLVNELGEMNIDIDSGHAGKAQVRITCE